MPGGRAGIVGVQHVLLGKSAMAEHWKTIRSVNTEFETAETSDKTVITLDTSPTRMPVGWVNFLKQRFHVLGIDYKHVGSGRIVVTSTPRAADSVVKLVVSAMETANDYAKTVLRNIRAQRIDENRDSIEATDRQTDLDRLAAKFDGLGR
jgi:hypothetical protein